MASERPGIALFEDTLVPELGPIVLVRPVFDLVLGAMTLRERIEQVAGQKAQAAIVRPRLAALLAQSDLVELHSDVPQLLVNAAWVADGATWEEVQGLEAGAALASGDGRIVALRPAPRMKEFSGVADGRIHPSASGVSVNAAPGARLLRHCWELIGWQQEMLRADLSRLGEEVGGPVGAGPALGRDLRVLPEGYGSEAGLQVRGRRVLVEEGVSIEGPAVLDSRDGTILLRRDAHIMPFSLLEGPLLVDEGASVLGGLISASFVGPFCRVRGEMESSVMLGWSNKAHDGFLGHSYVGSWVNIGALTTTSDLKNNYRIVRMGAPGEARSTGLIKVGSLIADHVKTAIGTLLGAGTVIGLGSSLFGASEMGPRWVPSFLWGLGPDATIHDLERFLRTAEVTYRRRGRSLSEQERGVLREAFEATCEERETWLRSRGD